MYNKLTTRKIYIQNNIITKAGYIIEYFISLKVASDYITKFVKLKIFF